MIKEKRLPISLEEALDRVRSRAQGGSFEYVDLFHASNRILGEDIISEINIPSVNRSGFDGFALRSEDTMTATSQQPVPLKIVGHIGAEGNYGKPLEKGQCVRIMTGSTVPEGADCVLMFEATSFGSDEREILVYKPQKKWDNVSLVGCDIKKGSFLIEKGEVLTPGRIAILATLGIHKVKVGEKPSVAVFATGNELVEPDQPLSVGKIRNSNGMMVCNQIQQLGGYPTYMGILPDSLEAYKERLEEALDTFDLVITTGGVSMGDYDFTLNAFEQLGAELLFNKVSVRPGSVTSVAYHPKKEKFLFGLSGNPSACFVGCEVYARIVIRTFQNAKRVYPKVLKGKLGEQLPKANSYTKFVRGRWENKEGEVRLSLSGFDKSSVVHSLEDANALLIFPMGSKGYCEGESLQYIPLFDQEGSAHFEKITDCRVSK